MTNSNPVKSCVRVFLYIVLRGLARFLFRVQVQGMDKALAAESGQHSRLLVIANHESFLDGILLGLFLPIKNPVFVVHREVIKSRFWRFGLDVMTDYLSVDPGNPMAMKQVIRLLESGRPVVIFPEGRITLTGSLMKVYDGPAFIAAKTGARLLPVRLDGPSRSAASAAHEPLASADAMPIAPRPDGAPAPHDRANSRHRLIRSRSTPRPAAVPTMEAASG